MHVLVVVWYAQAIEHSGTNSDNRFDGYISTQCQLHMAGTQHTCLSVSRKLSVRHIFISRSTFCMRPARAGRSKEQTFTHTLMNACTITHACTYRNMHTQTAIISYNVPTV